MTSLWDKYLPQAHPIYQAVIDRKADEVAEFFASGVSVYLADDNLPALFIFAWDEEDFSMMDLFFENGYDPNHELNRFCETPLMRASDNPKLFMHLIQLGADPLLKDKYENTCLHRAAANGTFAVADFCIENGIRVDVSDYLGCTPLRSAALAEQIAMMRHLNNVHGADLDFCLNDGRSILTQAAQAGKLESVKTLLELGANVKTKDVRGKTAADWALANGHYEIVSEIQTRSEQDDAGKPDPAAS